MLTGKTIVLGVTGSIAAYKIANLASMLVKLNADVHVIMTQNATHFITPMTFETLTNNKCIVDTFDRNFNFDVKHVSLAKRGDLFLVTTTIMATKAPVLFSPAMNTGMWENPVLQDNLKKLQHYGYHVIEPVVGRLACGDTGSGKMPSEETLLEHILLHLAREKDLKGKRLLITAGPTQEAIDPVRFISNRSSGKMGYALAKMAVLRGAQVTLVSGPVSIAPFAGVETVAVRSAQQMFEAVSERSTDSDVVIMCSAVADYKPASYSEQKLKKGDNDMSILLTRTQDILGWLGDHKQAGQVLVGFSMETENLIENSRRKLTKKHADLICANSIASEQTGFAVDTNKVTLITQANVTELPLCTKEETADLILDSIKDYIKN